MLRHILTGLGIGLAQTGRLLGFRRDVTLANLRRAYPDQLPAFYKKLLSRSYANLGRVFAEIVYLRYAKPRQIQKGIQFTNPEIFKHIIAQGKGLVIVAAHLANWEWMALAGPLYLDKTFSIVIKNNPVGFTEQFLQRMRRRTGNDLINSADVRRMFRTLQDGGCVALLGDQAAPAGSALVSFLGTTVSAFEGPARLALRTRSPMLFAKCVYERGSYRLTFMEVPFEDLTEDTPETVKELTQRHTSLLDAAIREHPEQWVWQHRRWKNFE
jgi:Kdo2-lipid IVA lauroyltransferase/acyltransferase